MNEQEQKLEHANRVRAAALAALAHARSDYNEGAGKALAETRANVTRLHGLLAEQEAAAVAAREALGRALRGSNGVATDKSRAALAARRDAEDLIEEYRAMIAEMARALVEATIAADGAAETYERAHSGAVDAHVQQVARSALAQCGEAMARAIAAGGGDIIEAELRRLAEPFRATTRGELAAAVGSVDLGALAQQDRLGATAGGLVKGVLEGRFAPSALNTMLHSRQVTPELEGALQALRGAV